MCKKKFYITTAIAYTSRKPHIGNSYEIVLTDAIARYKRMQGCDVFFLTGTDEHGQKIEDYAREAGVSPKEYVDGVAGEIRRICDLLNTTYDKFIRTTDDYHERAVQKIFKKLYEQGDIYKSEYEGMYCTPCESFWTPSQLKDGKCPDCGREVKAAKEEAYFLRLSKYQDRLERFIEDNPDYIYPESRKKEMVNNFIKPGLQDLCVQGLPSNGASRSISTPATSFMSGLTRCQTISRRSAMTRTAPESFTKNTGRPTYTLSARTSCGSTPFTGRLCSWRLASRSQSRCSAIRGCCSARIK